MKNALFVKKLFCPTEIQFFVDVIVHIIFAENVFYAQLDGII